MGVNPFYNGSFVNRASHDMFGALQPRRAVPCSVKSLRSVISLGCRLSVKSFPIPRCLSGGAEQKGFDSLRTTPLHPSLIVTGSERGKRDMCVSQCVCVCVGAYISRGWGSQDYTSGACVAAWWRDQFMSLPQTAWQPVPSQSPSASSSVPICHSTSECGHALV